jgi:hypothetical protein
MALFVCFMFIYNLHCWKSQIGCQNCHEMARDYIFTDLSYQKQSRSSRVLVVKYLVHSMQKVKRFFGFDSWKLALTEVSGQLEAPVVLLRRKRIKWKGERKVLPVVSLLAVHPVPLTTVTSCVSTCRAPCTTHNCDQLCLYLRCTLYHSQLWPVVSLLAVHPVPLTIVTSCVSACGAPCTTHNYPTGCSALSASSDILFICTRMGGSLFVWEHRPRALRTSAERKVHICVPRWD